MVIFRYMTVYQVALLLSNNGLHHSEQYCVLGCCAPFLYWQFALLYVRLLCSLPTTVRPQSAYFSHYLFPFYLNLS